MTKQQLRDWVETFKKMRSKASELKRTKSQEEFAKTFSLEEFGWKPSALWTKSLPAFYTEVQ
jgi:hypothetical protein